MPDDLYERDFHAWATREASLLQRLAQGERVNNALDAVNLAEEIESLGRSERREISNRIASAYQRALLNAEDETGLLRSVFPADCPYTPEQVLDPNYFPEPLVP